MTNVTFQAEIILELTLIRNGDKTVLEELSMFGLLGKFKATPVASAWGLLHLEDGLY